MPADGGEENPIIQMFEWWNDAYRRGAFDPEGFACFFTEDAPFIVSGVLRGTGPLEISAHFRQILSQTESVELILPVIETLISEEVGFVHYRAEARRGGQTEREDCLAVARFNGGRISFFEVLGRTI